MAKANFFRFSTKNQDDETDLLYYGYRYYNSAIGRWLNSDPLGERGGMNLYAFVKNRPPDDIDPNGLVTLVRDNVNKSVFTRCSFADIFYRISLSAPPPRKPGFFVQHITIDYNYQMCTGRMYTRHFEAWEDIGRVDTDPIRDRTWHTVDENLLSYPNGASKGYLTVSREVDFFELDVTGDLDALWAGGVPGMDTSPATGTAPSWWYSGFTGYEPAARNTWSVTWNCCCAGRPARFHDTAGGPVPEYNDK